MLTEDKPRFMLAAEELARRRGTAWEEVLDQDREGVRTSGYPGRDCLLPDEIESFFSERAGLAANRADHVATCPACASLLANAGADPVEAQEILNHVREQQTSPPEESKPSRISTGAGLGKMTKWVSIVGSAAAIAYLAARKVKRQATPEPARLDLPVGTSEAELRESREAPASL